MFAIAAKYGITLDENIKQMLEQNAVVAAGNSGGKDSIAMSLNLTRFLDEIGHDRTQRIYIHSDLGEEIEHADSLPTIKRLSEKTGIPLVVVKPLRPMIERWEKRWSDNAARFCQLSTVKLITPFSSNIFRFCTSESKVAPICKELKRRFPGKQIINAVGIRAEESPSRAKKPVSKINENLISKRDGTFGVDWNAIRDMKIEDVWLTHRRERFAPHEAYRKNGNSRVSCCVCVLANEREIRASMNDNRNHRAYARVVRLEIVSAFSFSQNYWLGDVCPELLDAETLAALAEAKEKAHARRLIEKEIPAELLYVKNDFPRFQPSLEQAGLIAGVRERIGARMNLPVKCTTAQTVYDRYAELLELKKKKQPKRQPKGFNTPIIEGMTVKQLSLFQQSQG